MFKTAITTVNNNNMLKKGDKIICALSGGPDSMALLFFLNELKRDYGFSVSAVHVNHMLRGEDSDADAQFVRDFCEGFGIGLLSVKKDAKKLSSEKKVSVEEAGRILRREAFANGLSHFSANKIATGHNKNDNAETFLLMLSRGAGTKGLSGIAPKTSDGGLCIIRPLLDCYREQIVNYCEENKIPFVTDKTNETEIYTRNKIRITLLPWLEKNLNSDIIGAITSAAGIVREQTEFLEDLVKDAFSACLLEKNNSSITLSAIRLNNYKDALKKLIIREAVNNLNGLYNLSAAHINLVLSLLNKGTGKRVSLPGGVLCERQYDLIVFRNNLPAQGFFYRLPINTPVYIKEKNKYALFSDCELNADNFKNLCTIMYKCDRILTEVCYRTRKPGDKIRLFGGTKKLGDYFIDKKIPRPVRDATALIADDYDILSILGVCDSEYVKSGCNNFFVHFWEDTNGNSSGVNTC